MLTVKQEKFCLEYAKCGNARQAYIKAGYKTQSETATDAAASRLLSNVKVKTRLAELAEIAENEAIADITEMQKALTAIIRQQATEDVLVSEGMGNGVTRTITEQKTPAIKDVINAINTLGKMQGAFIDKIEQEIDMELTISVDYGE